MMMIKQLLSWVLVLQLFVGVGLPQYSAAAPVKGEPVEQIVPKAVNAFQLDNQHHVIFAEGERGELTETQLPLSKPDISNPKVNIVDYSKELQYTVDRENHEFRIERIIKDEDTGETRVTNAHVFKNLELTAPAHINQNFILLPTTSGVRVILPYQMKEALFKAPIFAPKVIPQAMVEWGVRGKGDTQGVNEITDIYTVNRATAPPKAKHWNANDKVLDGDLVFTVAGQEYLIPQREVVLQVRMQMLRALMLLQIANPDLDNVNAVQEILVSHAEELKKIEKQQNMLVEGGEGNDFVRHALSNIAQQTDFARSAGLLKANKDGTDAYKNLADAEKDVLANKHHYQAWQKDFETITRLKESEQFQGKSWQDTLIASLNNNEIALQESAEIQVAVKKKLLARIWEGFKKFATPKRLKRTAYLLAAGSGGYFVNDAYGGVPAQEAVAVASQILDWSTNTPVVRIFGEKIASAVEYFKGSGAWGFGRWVTGVAIVASFQPLSYLVAKVAAARKSKNWDGRQAFFNYGLRIYARLNYSIQALAWNMLGRQKLLYQAMDQGVDPLKTTAAWNLPGASEKTIRNKEKRLNQIVSEDALRKSRALLIAAAVVSEKRDINLGALLMAGQGANPEYFLDILSDVKKKADWEMISTSAYDALLKMSDKGIGEVQPKTVGQYYRLYNKLADQLQADENGGVVRKAIVKLRKLRQGSKRLMSKNVLPFILFGKQGYDLYQKYKNAGIDKGGAEIAGEMYQKDYFFSTAYYSAGDAAKFAAIPVAGVHAPEIAFNQVEQIFIYGVQLGYDVLTTGDGGLKFPNPHAPLTNQLYADTRANHQQSLKEGLKVVTVDTLSPNTPSTFGTHQQFMKNMLTGFQVRLAVGAFARTFGLGLTKMLAGTAMTVPLFFSSLFNATILQSFVLLDKISFSLTGIGYATVWPYIIHLMQVLKGSTDGNLEKLQSVDYLIDAGIRHNDQAMLTDGVAKLQGLYRNSSTQKLPEWFDVAPEEYTPELAESLQKYSLENSPVSTKINQKVSLGLNAGIGAVVSTVLYITLSNTAYDPTMTTPEAVGIFAKSLVFFGATYAGLKALPSVTKTALTTCQGLLTKVKNVFSKNKAPNKTSGTE